MLRRSGAEGPRSRLPVAAPSAQSVTTKPTVTGALRARPRSRRAELGLLPAGLVIGEGGGGRVTLVVLTAR